MTAENGSTVRNYIVEITRAPAGASSNAKLDSLFADLTTADNAAITLSPGFKPDIENYTARVANSVVSERQSKCGCCSHKY